MANLDEIKAKIGEHKEELRLKYGVKQIGIFGSLARGEAGVESDVDVLVDFEKPIGLKFVELADFLEQILQMRVDLVPRGAVRPKMMQYVEEDLVYV